jgi:hypothetical protein
VPPPATAPLTPFAPPPPAPAAGAPPTVTISTEQYQVLTGAVTRMAQMESEQRGREDAARLEQVNLMAQRGEVEKALRETREDAERRVNAERAQRDTIERQAKRYAVDGELNRILASQSNLVPNAAEQLVQLWRNQFQAEPQGETFVVRTPSAQSPGDFIAAQLALPQYAHFQRPASQGGTGGGPGAQQSGPTPAANPAAAPVPKTLGEAVILHMQAIEKAKPSDTRLDMSSSMGLRRKI